MSRPWILGIVCCTLIINSALVGWGQEYLDLPDEPQDSGSTSWADKLSSLKDRFKRDRPQPQRAATTPSRRASPSTPRYRTTSKSASQKTSKSASQQTSKSASQQTSKSALQKQRSQPTNSDQQARKSLTSGITSRPQSKDLLPNAKLFSRTRQPLPQAPPSEAKQLIRGTSLPRAGSSFSKAATSKPASTRVARRSPTNSRANELDAALADLLQTKPARQRKPAVVKSIQPATKKSTKATTPVVSNTFDLRKALLDDEEDTIAAAAAKAVEEAFEAETTEPQVVEAPMEKPQPVAKIKKPAVEATPELKVTMPVAAKPIASEPIVVATPPKQTITISKPRPSPPVSAVISPKVVNDPFDSNAKQVFSSPQQPSNPMRAFQPTVETEQPTNTIARPVSGVLQTTQQPVIISHVEGPRSILVGREATYQVTLENTSSTSASNLSAEINVPEWAELVDAMSTSGVVERRSQGANAGVLEWKLSELAPRSSQALRLRLIPRSGRPLQLGIRWTQAPVLAQAIVEVQEPKLELAISGPQEVRFGKAQRYRLTLRNPGTGLTEKVVLRLIPPGGDAQSATTQTIGDLKPGAVKDIDLELTAREAGELLIQANAIAEGGLKAETTKNVLCRKPELKVDWRGPDKKYAGTVAAYYFRVQNPGTAATEPVNMSVKLPVGAEFISASEGYSINTTTGVVSWRLAGIDVSEEQFMQLRCKIARPGRNDFELIAKTSDGELSQSKAFQTYVVALADLKLEVTDPQGPLPLGESIVYEIRVKNRGTTDAENINIVGLFSEGIEPTTVEGAQFTVRDGRVSFHPIKILPAGREVLLRINAKANQVGTHIFRTEVTCAELDIKLAAEETTRFFEDEHRWEDGQTPYTAERDSTIKR